MEAAAGDSKGLEMFQSGRENLARSCSQSGPSFVLQSMSDVAPGL